MSGSGWMLVLGLRAMTAPKTTLLKGVPNNSCRILSCFPVCTVAIPETGTRCITESFISVMTETCSSVSGLDLEVSTGGGTAKSRTASGSSIGTTFFAFLLAFSFFSRSASSASHFSSSSLKGLSAEGCSGPFEDEDPPACSSGYSTKSSSVSASLRLEILLAVGWRRLGIGMGSGTSGKISVVFCLRLFVSSINFSFLSSLVAGCSGGASASSSYSRISSSLSSSSSITSTG